jgi:uncharacterized protein (DUF1330 family)
MPKGYLIARAIVTNPSAWAEYPAKATEAQKVYGGMPLVRGGRCEVVEGEGRARNVVIEFESFEQARAYAHSSEYAAGAQASRAGRRDRHRGRRGKLAWSQPPAHVPR